MKGKGTASQGEGRRGDGNMCRKKDKVSLDTGSTGPIEVLLIARSLVE